jgi:hypothetical protein
VKSPSVVEDASKDTWLKWRDRKAHADFNNLAHERSALHMLGNELETGLLEDVFTAGEPVSASAAITDGQVLKWDATNRLWRPLTISSGGVGSPWLNKPNKWYAHPGSSIATTTLELDECEIHPMVVGESTIIDKVAIQVSSGATSSIRVLIYSDNGNGYPDQKLATSAAISTAAAVIVEATLSITLDAGLYWIGAYKESGSSQTNTSLATPFWPPFIGNASAFDPRSSGYNKLTAGTGGVMPTTFPTDANNASPVTWIWWHVAA